MAEPWIKCSERLPEMDGASYVTFRSGYKDPTLDGISVDTAQWQALWYGHIKHGAGVTHWMCLEPPDTSSAHAPKDGQHFQHKPECQENTPSEYLGEDTIPACTCHAPKDETPQGTLLADDWHKVADSRSAEILRLHETVDALHQKLEATETERDDWTVKAIAALTSVLRLRWPRWWRC